MCSLKVMYNFLEADASPTTRLMDRIFSVLEIHYAGYRVSSARESPDGEGALTGECIAHSGVIIVFVSVY